MPLSRRGDRGAARDAEEIQGYRLLEPAGHGGFSVVYRAQQETLDRIVAVKLLTVDYVDPKVRKRFLREVQLTTRLSGHPHVVTVLDAGVTRSRRPYIVMDFFEQGSLQDRLDAQGALPAADVARIGVKICGALTAAHDLGILHRDIKPQNILVSRFGEPALADFGVALLADSAARTSRTDALTPYHAAPEILDGAQPSPAADIYSLGSALYQLLAGRPAYRQEGGAIAPMLLRIMNEPPPPLTRPDVPASLRDAVLRAMTKQPGERFSSAADFASALGAAIEAAPGHAPHSDMPPQQVIKPPPSGTTLPDSVPVPHSPDTATVPPGPDGKNRQNEHRRQQQDGQAGYDGRDWQDGQQTPLRTDPGETVMRPGRAVPMQVASEAKKPGWRRWQLAAGVGAIAVAAAVGLLLRGGFATGAKPHSTTTPSPSATRVSRQQLAAARPAGLSVTDDGAAVQLRWRNPKGTDYPMFVEIKPRPATGSLRSAGTGAISAIVTGLDPSAGYCFEVGAVVTFGNPSTVAWSAPACIRGAAGTTPGPG
jgi:serine/threonine protein kinase